MFGKPACWGPGESCLLQTRTLHPLQAESGGRPHPTLMTASPPRGPTCQGHHIGGGGFNIRICGEMDIHPKTSGLNGDRILRGSVWCFQLGLGQNPACCLDRSRGAQGPRFLTPSPSSAQSQSRARCLSSAPTSVLGSYVGTSTSPDRHVKPAARPA